MTNALNIIYPYKFEDMWVFDDEAVGLIKEPFVEGADVLIEQALEAKSITDGERGFRLIFSAGEFPRVDLKLNWIREADGGNYYAAEDSGLEGWLCPALFKYFENAPSTIYARFEAKPT